MHLYQNYNSKVLFLSSEIHCHYRANTEKYRHIYVQEDTHTEIYGKQIYSIRIQQFGVNRVRFTYSTSRTASWTSVQLLAVSNGGQPTCSEARDKICLLLLRASESPSVQLFFHAEQVSRAVHAGQLTAISASGRAGIHSGGNTFIVYSFAFWTVRYSYTTAAVGWQIVCAESVHDKLFFNKGHCSVMQPLQDLP